MNSGQLIVTAVALVMLLTPLFVLSFLAGRRSVSSKTNWQFDQMRPDIVLQPGAWQAEFDADDEQQSQVIQFDLQQVGSRIVGSGRSAGGIVHSLEGILDQRRLCGVCMDETRQGTWLGTVTAELLPGEQQMVGMRMRWPPETKSLIVRKATFTRTR